MKNEAMVNDTEPRMMSINIVPIAVEGGQRCVPIDFG